VGGALEHQVLEEVGEPGAPGFLAARADVIPDVHRGQRHGVVLVQGNGGSLNATTNPDRTNYFETLPSEHLELALWLEADRMGGLVPALTQETLDNQREVVKNERRQRYENVPYGDAWLRLLPLLYPEGHPYHHSTIGSMDDLNAAELGTFKAFHQQYYAPNNAVLTVAGDASPAEVYALAEKYFGQLEAVTDIPPAPGGHITGAATKPVRETVTGAVPAPRIYLSHRTHPFGSAGYDAITVLSTVLGSALEPYRGFASIDTHTYPRAVSARKVVFRHWVFGLRAFSCFCERVSSAGSSVGQVPLESEK